MLCIKNLNIYYQKGNVKALNDVNLQIKRGGIYAFIGPSGCGKSSLLNTLAGNVKSYTGEILLNNEELNHKKQTIGLIAQNFGLLPWKTVYANICLGLKVKKLDISKYEKQIQYVMEKLDILDFKHRYPNQLSGGQKQRVAIARTFIMDLDLLLMDEPFSALDTITREETQDLFVEIWNEKTTTTLFVTHSVDEAVFLGQKIVVMSKCPGKIIKILNNDSFGLTEARSTIEFLNISTQIRQIIKEEWVNKND